ncbi:MAG: hypothetical protein ACRDOK_05480 [Streptosporangiaceae bacterium]
MVERTILGLGGQLAARLRAGEACQDNGLIFGQADGSPWRPDYVSRCFKAIA